ncbi:MAG: dipeptide/oligopeptide/nickel ABC transporter permease/ATP-binding protein [Lacisediminihabitans sp.]
MTSLIDPTVTIVKPRVFSLGILRQRVLPTMALLVILLVTVAVYAAPLLTSYSPLKQSLLHALEGSSAAHPLGTDGLGRDILSRLLWGGQPTLSGVVVAVVVFAFVGMTLGILAGYLGGVTDRVIGALLDIMLSIPSIILILAVLAIFNQNIFAAMVVLGLFAAAGLARVIRSLCFALREELFVDAARVSGLTPLRIMTRHILPALMGQLLVQMSLFAGIALAVQTGLGFLGLGTPAPNPSWGGMVGESAQVIQQDPFFLLISGGIIGVMSVAFGLLGDGLRDFEADRRRSVGAARPVPLRVPKSVGAAERQHGGLPALLTVTDYSVGFATTAGAQAVVDSISFTVQEGEIFGLVGESGSGKTVTALALLGLLPENGGVLGGEAWLGSQQISPAAERELRRVRGREIGYVSQEPMVALDPHFTIGSQLGEVVRTIGNVGTSRAAIRVKSLELLASVKLPNPQDVMRRYPHELSGGMIQRVVIAIALAGSPRLLIADEPTTALDVTVQAGILDLLRSLRDDRGMAIILVTHDLGVVADICDRAIVMRHGRIVEQGPIETIFYEPKDPYTIELIASTPNIARNVDV